jgi:tetratricopeptide (TPR) repeat protein
MLTLSLATFAQNATKVVIFDVFNKEGTIRQSTLAELKTNLAQAISDNRGYEGVVDDNVDATLRAAGFAEHPRLSKEQAEQVADLAGTQYGLMSEASIDNLGYLISTVILIDLKDYKILIKDTSKMNINSDGVRKGCETIAKKIIAKLPKPKEPIVENKTESKEEEIIITESMQPRQLTSKEAEDVARHLNRADVCIEMGYIDNAIKEYEKILEIAPFWPNAYMFLAESSLAKARKNYKIFMRLTDDQDLYNEAKDKVSRMEMMSELIGMEDENAENLVGTWKSDIYDEYTGQPWFVVDISKTSIPNKYQIILSPKSMMYNNKVSTKAYSDIIDGKISWAYSFQETYIPSQAKYNAAGAAINLLFGSGSVASTVGNLLVEVGRESDIGYTNIMDFDFLVNVYIQDIQDDYYKKLSDKYIEGSCQMRGEHHQAGRNSVDLDTVRECNFIRGDGLYPVFVKVKEIGGSYFYGDIKLTDNNTIMNYSPYISKNEFDSKYQSLKTTSTVFGVIGGASLGFLLSGLVCNGVVSGPKVFGNTFFVITGIASGASLITCIVSTSQWKNYLRQCYSIHNRQVDENIRKFSQRDQASVSVNVGLTPTGVGVSLNF